MTVKATDDELIKQDWEITPASIRVLELEAHLRLAKLDKLRESTPGSRIPTDVFAEAILALLNEREDYRAYLSAISSSLGCGSREDTTTPKSFYEGIQQGLDTLIRVEETRRYELMDQKKALEAKIADLEDRLAQSPYSVRTPTPATVWSGGYCGTCHVYWVKEHSCADAPSNVGGHGI